MPYHPYTNALLHSIPNFKQPLPHKGRLNTLKGTMPLLEQNARWMQIRTSLPFSQSKMWCVIKPLTKHLKHRDFSCHFPLNLRENQRKRKRKCLYSAYY